MISQRAQLLKPSPTLAMANRARELQTKGLDVVSLTVGEPDWATYPAASEAGIQAIRDGFTKYTPAHGILELRQEIAKQTSSQLKVNYQANEVVVGNGAKYILFAGMMMLLNPGDEVLIPTPYWVSYPTMAELAGGVPKFIDCGPQENFKLTAQNLKKAITKKSKLLILCSPSNPTGLQYSKEELLSLAQILKEYPNLVIVSDDIYNQLTFKGDLAPHLLHVASELRNRTFVVNGMSKTYSMTGWRVGWGLGPSELIQPLADFLSQTTSNISSISQKAALAALKNCTADVQSARVSLLKKKEKFQSALEQIAGFRVIPPDGAFYLWLDVRDFLNRKHKSANQILVDSKSISEVLLNNHYLATVPGVEFGAEGYLRLSFATSESNLEKAILRLKEFSQESLT